MKFKKEFLRELLWDDADGAEKVYDEITDTSRWSIHHWMVFKFNGKYYGTSYSVGATECQEEQPFEYDPEEIDCSELIPVEKKIIVYEAVKE